MDGGYVGSAVNAGPALGSYPWGPSWGASLGCCPGVPPWGSARGSWLAGLAFLVCCFILWDFEIFLIITNFLRS